MTHTGDRVRPASPFNLLRVYMFVVVVSSILAVSGVLLTTARVDRQSQLATEQAAAAAAAAQINVELRDPMVALFVTALAFVHGEELASIPAAAKAYILDTIVSRPRTSSVPLTTVPLPPMTVTITDADAYTLQSGMERASSSIDALLAPMDMGVDLAPVLAERDRLESALATYIETKSAESFRDTFASGHMLGSRLSEASQSYNAALARTQDSLASSTAMARYTTVTALVTLTMTMVVATYYVGRLIQKAFRTIEAEGEELREMTATLQYRNDQLNALYNVFAEITDTLSMRYVIRATLRETLRVMHASFVTLRLLKGGQLVAAGTLADDGAEPLLDPVPLGEGPTGRVARRGRSMRIDYGAQEQLGLSSDPDKRVESGVIVPLIVGARIVGTLSCWSVEPKAFHEQDERVLEMMASQVATAVIAADQQEVLERRALSDPLTNLPNRRQLADDMAEFGKWQHEGRGAVVAMMDIDHFKQLNDDFGHKVGDVTLQKVAAVMRQAIRDSDRIYRYGGEEFLIIFSGAGEDDALTLAERVLRAVSETPLTGDHLEPVGPVTLSAGLAIMPDHGSDISELIGLADRAMYRAKESGRNRIAIWDETSPLVVTSAA
jgi:diguanylate cyclase (GGDEF)-like protein